MISNLILQDTINGIKSITGAELAIAEPDGKIIASSVPDMPVLPKEISLFGRSDENTGGSAGYTFFKIFDDYQLEYILAIEEGAGDTVGHLAAFQIKNLLIAYKEHFDKDNFIKNLLLDNLLLVDIYSRAKKLRIAADVRRVVYILESDGRHDSSSLEEIKNRYAGAKTDFITALDEKSTIIIKELDDKDGPEALHETAKEILSAAKAADSETVRVAYGNIVNEIKEVSRSYKEARMALDVGKIFFEDSNIIAYSQLGIGRIIYQLPIPLCRMFIKEIFANRSLEDFDEPTLATINKFFENNLNVSETSRQLYIHRNTLVYRLDKLQKSTGLDLRVFEDAITFKIALMVVRYMKYMESLEY